MRKLVSVLSGGLDSTTALYRAREEGNDIVHAVSFHYGQRHKKELFYAAHAAQRFEIPHTTIDLDSSGLTAILGATGSSLTNHDVDVPEGHYAEENMKATVVPNRNMMMVSIAGSIAVAKNANGIIMGVHSGDHAIYPDCRPEFFHHVRNALYWGNEGFGELLEPRGSEVNNPVYTPYLFATKDDIAYDALKLRVPLELTWSCYKGGERHCGRCGTCVERLEAIYNAHIHMYGKSWDPAIENHDHTEYEDSEYWKEALEHAPEA